MEALESPAALPLGRAGAADAASCCAQQQEPRLDLHAAAKPAQQGPRIYVEAFHSSESPRTSIAGAPLPAAAAPLAGEVAVGVRAAAAGGPAAAAAPARGETAGMPLCFCFSLCRGGAAGEGGFEAGLCVAPFERRGT